MIPFPRPAVSFDACPWCASVERPCCGDQRGVGLMRRRSVVEHVEDERRKHQGGPHVVPKALESLRGGARDVPSLDDIRPLRMADLDGVAGAIEVMQSNDDRDAARLLAMASDIDAQLTKDACRRAARGIADEIDARLLDRILRGEGGLMCSHAPVPLLADPPPSRRCTGCDADMPPDSTGRCEPCTKADVAFCCLRGPHSWREDKRRNPHLEHLRNYDGDHFQH